MRGHIEAAVLEQHRQEGREANAALMERFMEQVGCVGDSESVPEHDLRRALSKERPT